MHDSVYEIAGNDPRIAKFLRTALTALADSPDPLLREMAGGVLDGTVDLRHAVGSDAYSGSLSTGFRQFWHDYDNLNEDERLELQGKGEDYLDVLLDEPDRSSERRGL